MMFSFSDRLISMDGIHNELLALPHPTDGFIPFYLPYCPGKLHSDFFIGNMSRAHRLIVGQVSQKSDMAD